MKTQDVQKEKKSPKKALIIAGALLCLLAIPLILLLMLLGRITRTETPALPPAPVNASTPAPTAAPAVSAAPAPAATPTPQPTPTPTPLPMSEVYPQTFLTDEQYAQMQADNENPDYRNVLLLGVDRRGTSGASSADTMMIATIDKAHGRLKLTSLLRDTLVAIPGREGYNKLNSAMVYGGSALLLQTINENYRLTLSDYVLVDFNMFIELIDAMGGVTVKMTAEEISAANDCIAGLNRQWGVDYLWDGFIFAEAGNVKCTGKQALGYARIRHLDSDFKRSDRQFKVLTAVFAKFKDQSAAQQYAILYKLLPMVETNMKNEAILDCAVQAFGLRANGLLHSRMPADDTYKSGRYDKRAVLLTDVTQNALLVHRFIYQDAEEAETAQVLTPGASLPPRTPRQTIAMQDANGNTVYYYTDGTLVPGQTIGGMPVAEQTPWQSVGGMAEPEQTPWQSVSEAAPAG